MAQQYVAAPFGAVHFHKKDDAWSAIVNTTKRRSRTLRIQVRAQRAKMDCGKYSVFSGTTDRRKYEIAQSRPTVPKFRVGKLRGEEMTAALHGRACD